MEDPTDMDAACDALAVRNARVSPLLRLSAELRNAIYAYVLTEPTKIYTYAFKYLSLTQSRSAAWDARLIDAQDHPRRLALLITSRQIHLEARLLPFELNTFHFRSLMVFGRFTRSQFAVLRNAITKLTIGDCKFWKVENFNKMMQRSGDRHLRQLLPNVRTVVLLAPPFKDAPTSYELFGEDWQRLVDWFEGPEKSVTLTLIK